MAGLRRSRDFFNSYRGVLIVAALALTVAGAWVAYLNWESVYDLLGLPRCRVGTGVINLALPCEPQASVVQAATIAAAIAVPLALGTGADAVLKHGQAIEERHRGRGG